MKVLFTVMLFAGALLGQTVQAGNPNALKPAFSITVLPWASPADNASVRITRVALVNDSLRLEIENNSSDAVIAVGIGYPFSGCFSGLASIGSADAMRFPGMDSVNVPPHGRVWYTDGHMASYLATAATNNKTRYVQARAGIDSVVFANGKRVDFVENEKAKQLAQSNLEAAVRGGTCQAWRWEEALDGVNAFQPPSDTTTNKVRRNDREAGVSYTCTVHDNLIHCPD